MFVLLRRIIFVNGRIYEAAKAVEDGENESGFKAVIARPKEKVQTWEINSSYSNGARLNKTG